jgi:hypothetical protein
VQPQTRGALTSTTSAFRNFALAFTLLTFSPYIALGQRNTSLAPGGTASMRPEGERTPRMLTAGRRSRPLQRVVPREPANPKPGYTTSRVGYVNSMFTPRTHDSVLLATICEFTYKLAHPASPVPTLFEVLSPDKFVRPFWDMERYTDSQPSPEDMCATHHGNIDLITTFMRQLDPTGTFEPKEHLVAAERSRYVVHNGKQAYKVSFRYYAVGYKVKPAALAAAMAVARSASGAPLFPPESGFDLTVYPKHGIRLLGSLLCAKGKGGDKALLQALANQDGSTPDIDSYVVGYVQASTTCGCEQQQRGR